MHELSIALSIIDECSREACARGASRVSKVYLKLGPLSGVVQEALMFSYELACEDTPLAGSSLVVEEVPVIIYCDNCGVERALPSIQQFICPVCGRNAARVVSGRELQIAAMEIEDEPGAIHDPEPGSLYQEATS